MVQNKKEPVTCIIGGSKISTKINVITNLIQKVNNLIIVGAMANNFFIYKNLKVGKSLIEKNSGSIISNVTKKLDYLIIGDKPTKKKIDTANEMNIKILTQSDWLKMLNKSS